MKVDSNLRTTAATALRLVAVTSLFIACGPPAVNGGGGGGGGGTADAGAQILAYPYRVLLIIILWIYRTMFCRCIGNIGSSEHRAAGYVLKLGIAFDSVSVSSGLSLMLRHLFKAQAVLSEHRQSFQSTGSLFRASAGRGCNDISCFISLPFVFVGFCSTKNLNSARNIPYVI